MRTAETFGCRQHVIFSSICLSPQRNDHPGAIARRRHDAIAAIARLGEIPFSELGEKTLRRFSLD